MEVLQVLILYIVVINAAGLLAMGVDKRRSKSRRKWRISEAAMFTIAFFGGTIGCIGGMYLFHHKTNKPAFQYGMPAILGFQLFLILITWLFLPFRFRVM